MTHDIDREAYKAGMVEECCVWHNDESPGQCVKCRRCKQWIRPHKFDEDCPGPNVAKETK